VNQQHWRVKDLGESDGSVGGFAFDRARTRTGMVFRLNQAGALQRVGQPGDGLGVFGVDHDHRLFAPGKGQHVEDFAVVQLHVVIGHVDLERGISLADQGRQFLPQHRRSRVADDQVEGVIDQRFTIGAGVVIVDRRA